MKQNKSFDKNAREYRFYTYDPTGKDCIITIRAENRDDAFEKFDLQYGTDTMIDCCVEVGREYRNF
jgi:hypothetical protein